MHPTIMAWRSAPAFLLLVCLTHAARRPGREEVRFRRAQPTPQPGAALIASKLVRSSVECAKLCTSHFRCKCRSYGYSRKSRNCSLYSERHLDGAAGNSADWIFYSPAYLLGGMDSPCDGHENCDCVSGAVCDSGFCQCPRRFQPDSSSNKCPPDKTYGIPCTGNDACGTASQFECREGECTCVAGYHYHPARDTCLATCPDGYGDGYYKVYAECLEGNNADSEHDDGLTLEQCWQWCRSDPKCRTFEHRPGQCHKSYTTKLEQPNAWKKCGGPPPMSYYQRHCA